ncbi:MAG: sigma-70 family RNA polymerase sigma factor [Cetobacterium sp.]
MNKIIYEAQLGNQQSIDKLIKLNQKLIINIIRRNNFFILNGEKEDLIQEGNIGLMKAISYFNIKKNTKFETFAELCIKRQIITYIEKQNINKQKLLTAAINYYPKSFENEEEVFLEKLGVNYNTPESIFIRKEELKLMLNNINQLKFSQLETRILNLLFKEYEYSDIIKILNEKPKKIDNTIQRIRKKIKKLINK